MYLYQYVYAVTFITNSKEVSKSVNCLYAFVRTLMCLSACSVPLETMFMPMASPVVARNWIKRSRPEAIAFIRRSRANLKYFD